MEFAKSKRHQNNKRSVSPKSLADSFLGRANAKPISAAEIAEHAQKGEYYKATLEGLVQQRSSLNRRG